MTRRFWCANGAGDTIYFLSCVKRLGGGEYFFYPHPDERCRMSPEHANSLCTLLACQSYIKACGWRHSRGDGTDLSEVLGRGYQRYLNLTDMCCRFLDMPLPSREEPWIEVPGPVRAIAPVIVNRSPRWRNDNFPWRRVVAEYGRSITFIGHLSEYEEFCHNFGRVSYFYTPTYIDAVQVLAGAKLFIGNQSSMAAMAEGIKMPVVQETLPHDSWWWNCEWCRPNRIHGYDNNVSLPVI